MGTMQPAKGPVKGRTRPAGQVKISAGPTACGDRTRAFPTLDDADLASGSPGPYGAAQMPIDRSTPMSLMSPPLWSQRLRAVISAIAVAVITAAAALPAAPGPAPPARGPRQAPATAAARRQGGFRAGGTATDPGHDPLDDAVDDVVQPGAALVGPGPARLGQPPGHLHRRHVPPARRQPLQRRVRLRPGQGDVGRRPGGPGLDRRDEDLEHPRR